MTPGGEPSVALVGDFSPGRDEGLKVLSKELLRVLGSGARVTPHHFHPRGLPRLRRAMGSGAWDVVHTVLGPTWRTTAALAWGRRRTPLILSAVHPRLGRALRLATSLGRADAVLCQSPGTARFFEDRGVATALVPNGVDLLRFQVPTEEQRRAIRSRLAIPPDAFVVLHVGHAVANRNLSLLTQVTDLGAYALLVAGTARGVDPDLVRRLRSGGVRVMVGEVPNVEDLYGASDCYLFPTAPGETIEMPLSVLEALACGIPVASRDHPGLGHFIGHGAGLWLGSNDEDLLGLVAEMVAGGRRGNPRGLVQGLDWRSVGGRILEAYGRVLV